jgi:hypothetical protein
MRILVAECDHTLFVAPVAALLSEPFRLWALTDAVNTVTQCSSIIADEGVLTQTSRGRQPYQW